jgi:MbtH protein
VPVIPYFAEPEEPMEDDIQSYVVVLNDEEQYSIWPAGRDLPLGWRGDGVRGSREECLARIGEVWTDMRPLSLRRAGERTGSAPRSHSEG